MSLIKNSKYNSFELNSHINEIIISELPFEVEFSTKTEGYLPNYKSGTRVEGKTDKEIVDTLISQMNNFLKKQTNASNTFIAHYTTESIIAPRISGMDFTDKPNYFTAYYTARPDDTGEIVDITAWLVMRGKFKNLPKANAIPFTVLDGELQK